MTAPAFRSAGTIVGTSGANTDVTPGAPAGATTDDILILFAGARGNDVPTDLPNISANGTGWTEISSYYLDIGTSGMTARAWWYRVSGSLPTMPSVRHPSANQGPGLAAKICCYSGCETSGTPWESVSGNGGSLASGVGVSVTTTGDDRLILMNYFMDDSTTSNPGSGWTEDSETTLASPVSCIANDSIVRATAGTQAAPTRSFTERYSCLGFALLPSAGGAPSPSPAPPNQLMMTGCGT